MRVKLVCLFQQEDKKTEAWANAIIRTMVINRISVAEVLPQLYTFI